MRSKKANTRILLADEMLNTTPINSAFAQLARDFSGRDKTDAPRAMSPATDNGPSQNLDAELDTALQHLRKPHIFESRKDRGGKTVTLIEHVQPMQPLQLAALCKRLCKRLGCGGSIEGDVVILQGAHTQAVAAFFAAAHL